MPTTTRRLQPLILPGAYPVLITTEQWRDYIAPQLEDQRGELETHGRWSLPVRYVAPCMTIQWGPTPYGSEILAVTLWGKRTMGKLKESGYQLEGKVSLGGRTISAFTSSQMFQLPDGRLLESAVIHARGAELLPTHTETEAASC